MLLIALILLIVEYVESSYYTFGLTRCDLDHSFTIHGLWPNQKEFCSEEKFDVKNIEPIIDKMELNWFSCYGNDTEFWDHEWSKHGTCTNFTQINYFNKSLWLYDKIIINNYTHFCNAKEKECELYFDKNYNIVKS